MNNYRPSHRLHRNTRLTLGPPRVFLPLSFEHGEMYHPGFRKAQECEEIPPLPIRVKAGGVDANRSGLQ